MIQYKPYLVIILLVLLSAVLSAEQADTEEARGLGFLKQNGIAFTDVNFYRYLNGDRVEVVEAFLDAGYDVNKRNQASQTPLIVASDEGCLKTVELLLRRGADINASDIDGCTALMYAGDKKRAQIVALLIANKADVNLQNDSGWTALMFAIDSGNKETIDAMITIDTDAMLKNKDNKTARDFAKEHRFDKLPQYIIDKITYLQKHKVPKKKFTLRNLF